MDPNDLAIGDAVAGQWHYVAFVFDTQGNTQVDNTITGNATAYFDSLEPIALGEATKSAFGDSLARAIGVGQHPIGDLRAAFGNRRGTDRRGGPGEVDELAESLASAFVRERRAGSRRAS